MGLFNCKGKYAVDLTKYEIEKCVTLLSKKFEVDGEQVTYIDWLKDYRIDTVLAAAGIEAFWNWLKWKLENVWARRDYNRAIFFNNYLYTPMMDKFIDWYQKQSAEVIKARLGEKREELSDVRGFYEDVSTEKENVEQDIIDNTMLPNEQIKKVDLALDALMNGSTTAD